MVVSSSASLRQLCASLRKHCQALRQVALRPVGAEAVPLPEAHRRVDTEAAAREVVEVAHHQGAQEALA